MDYSLLTEQQLQKRQYNLPDNIREVLGSEKEIETIRQICRNHYLIDDEKILIVEQLVGLVLLGFVPVDNLSREISENIHLNKKHADDIVIEIDRKIFNSIRADLEKIYVPPAEEIEADKRGLEYGEKSIPIEIEKPEAFMASKVESPIRIIGMEEEVPQPDILHAESLESKPLAEIKPEFSSAIQKGPLAAGETEPMIIHKETEFKPLSETKKSLKPLGGLFGFLSKKEKPEEVKPVRAEVSGIDMGNEKLGMRNEEQKEIKPINTKIRTINYTEVPDDQRPTRNDQPQIINNDNKIESPIKIVEEKKETPVIIPSGEIFQPDVSRVESPEMKEQPVIDNKQPTIELRTGEVEPPVVSEVEPIIIHQETGQKSKKFFSGLSGFFSRKKIEADERGDVITKAKPEAISVNNEIASLSARNDVEVDKSRIADSSAGESPIKIIEKEIPKVEPEKMKMTDIQLKPELPMKITEEINASQLPVEKNFFRTLIDSSKSLFIEKKKEIHYKEEIKPTTDKR